MTDCKTIKGALRKKMLVKRARTKADVKKKYDQWICNELEKIILKRACKVVHAYLPMGKEINITPLLSSLLEQGITVVTPKTLPKRKLLNLVLHSLTAVEKGVFGTTHPANSIAYTGTYDLVIVPGLAFDKKNYRLGYGGGYYDTFLANCPNAHKVGIFYPFQEVDTVPTEAHDVQLDTILTRSL